jgi:hypothetical protein
MTTGLGFGFLSGDNNITCFEDSIRIQQIGLYQCEDKALSKPQRCLPPPRSVRISSSFSGSFADQILHGPRYFL